MRCAETLACLDADQRRGVSGTDFDFIKSHGVGGRLGRTTHVGAPTAPTGSC
jgi:hypothetical protein